MPLTTIGRVRQRLGIVSDGASGINDTEITSLIVEMESAIKGWCGVVRFEDGAYDETHDGGYPIIPLRANYADEVTEVSVIAADGTETVYGPNAWRLDKATATLIHARGGSWVYGDHSCGSFPEGYRNIRVQATAGYPVVPDDLTFAATEIVKDALLDRIQSARNGSTSQNGTTIQRRSWAELLSEHEWRLSRWRRTAP